jgi:hypothetical protein
MRDGLAERESVAAWGRFSAAWKQATASMKTASRLAGLRELPMVLFSTLVDLRLSEQFAGPKARLGGIDGNCNPDTRAGI